MKRAEPYCGAAESSNEKMDVEWYIEQLFEYGTGSPYGSIGIPHIFGQGFPGGKTGDCMERVSGAAVPGECRMVLQAE